MTNKGSSGSNPNQPFLELNESETEQPFTNIWGPQPDQAILGQRFFAQGEGENNRTLVPGTQQLPIGNPRNMPPNYETRSLPIMRQQLPPQGEMRHEYSLWGQNPSSQGHPTEQHIHFGPTISTDQTQQQTRHNFQTQYQNQLIQSYKEFGAQQRQQNSMLGGVTEMTAIQDDNIRKFVKFTISDQISQSNITGAISTQGKEDCKTETYPIGTNRNQEWGQNAGQFGFSPNQGLFGPSQNPGQFCPSPHQGQLEPVPKLGHFGPPQNPGLSSSKHQKSDAKIPKFEDWSLWHMPPSKKRPCILEKLIEFFLHVDRTLLKYKFDPLQDGESYYFIPEGFNPSAIEKLVQNRLVCFLKPIPTDTYRSSTGDVSFLGREFNHMLKAVINVNYDDYEGAAIYRQFVIGVVMERQQTSDRSWNQRICFLLSAHSREQFGTNLINYFRCKFRGLFDTERIYYDEDAQSYPPSHP